MTHPTRRGSPSRWAIACWMTLVVTPAGAAMAGAPTPLEPSQFAFPGWFETPATARSAGLALADRWLGEEPFANPAVAPGHRLIASPALLRVSRQDLRAHNRDYDETAGYFDGAGAALGLSSGERLGLSLYSFQPLLRSEDNAYSRGLATPDPDNPPAVMQTSARAREVRTGLAVSTAARGGRIGLGIEWVHRRDAYRTVEQSGNPASDGTKEIEFTGNGMGFQLGGRFGHGDRTSGGVGVGVGARFLPALSVDVPHSEMLLVGNTQDTLQARRAAAWEVGTTVIWAGRPTFRALAAVSARSAQRWEGIDLEAGSAWEWKLGWEYQDPQAPWAFRFGLGQEHQSGVPEPRALVLGLGVGREFAGLAADVGVLHRTLSRDDNPNSFDDRFVLTIRFPR
jgi:hypothetical protein